LREALTGGGVTRSRRKIGKPAHVTPEHEALQPLTAALLEGVTPAEVVSAVVERGIAILGAEAGLVVLVSEDGAYLDIVHSRGYAPKVMEVWHHFPLHPTDMPLPLSDAVRDAVPLFFTGRADWEARYPEVLTRPTHPVKASVSLPLVARGKSFGGIHFSFPDEREFTEADREILGELGRQCALSLDRALLWERAEGDRARLEFLARASDLLGDSLDCAATLEHLARLAVPDLADWAAVDMLSEDGSALERLAVAHVDPERVAWARALQERYPTDLDALTGLARVLRTGEAEFYPEVTDEMIRAAARDPEHLAIIQAVGIVSVILAPLIARGRTLGALTFVTTAESGRRYTSADRALTEELARRAAVAVDNARLFGAAQREIAERRDAQRGLARREREYAAVAENADDVMARFDADLRFLYANHATERHIGVPPEAVVGRTLSELGFPEDNLAHWSAAIHTVFETGERQVIRFAYPSPTLGLRWYEASITPEALRGGERDEGTSPPETVIVVARDVTDQERLVHRLQQLFDSSVVGVIYWNLDTGRITDANDTFLDMVGYTRDDLAAGLLNFRAMTPPEWAERNEQGLTAIRSDGFAATYEKEYFRKDGSRVPILIGGTRFEDASVEGYSYILDISEQKVREAERRVLLAQQRRFVREMLFAMTDGRLRVCDSAADLPTPLPPICPPVELTLSTLRRLRQDAGTAGDLLDLSAERAHDLVTAVG
jgi:PAS domain S-box-containing protein